MLSEIERFVNWVHRRSPEARTWKDYGYDLRFFMQVVEDRPLREITFRDIDHFIAIQSETAIRALASEYPYDAEDEDVPSLRGRPQEISERMKHQVQSRLDIAGIEITDARISHLAYSPEIAQTMLRRQQAQAVIAARKKIVEGAVSMVDQALRTLSEQKIVTLDEDKKATMVNNLLVALVSESQAQPVINTGTLYQ